MRCSALLAASFERCASEGTSSATTAKPRPASPARGLHRGVEGEEFRLEGDLVEVLDDQGGAFRRGPDLAHGPIECSMAILPSPAAPLSALAGKEASWALAAALAAWRAGSATLFCVGSAPSHTRRPPRPASRIRRTVILALPHVTVGRITCGRSCLGRRGDPPTEGSSVARPILSVRTSNGDQWSRTPRRTSRSASCAPRLEANGTEDGAGGDGPPEFQGRRALRGGARPALSGAASAVPGGGRAIRQKLVRHSLASEESLQPFASLRLAEAVAVEPVSQFGDARNGWIQRAAGCVRAGHAQNPLRRGL